MQLRLDQLDKHLKNELAPLYLISGEVPLLMQEACDAVRKTAAQHGFIEREVLQIETGFNWNIFATATNTLSLFSSKQLLELRIGNALGEAGGKALQSYLEHLPSDKILLISTGKLDAKIQKTSWFQTINKIGITVPIWPIETQQLPNWITQRLAKAELQAEPAGIQLLAECAEGNLLAGAQEIEKLKLTYGKGLLSTEAIAKAVSNSSRFDVFNLVDAALLGENKRIVQILNGLKSEGVEAILVLWALARELRTLVNMGLGSTQGVWEKRKPLLRNALKQHSIKNLQQLLQHAHKIDCMIKGLKTGNVWDELQTLSLAIAGTSL